MRSTCLSCLCSNHSSISKAPSEMNRLSTFAAGLRDRVRSTAYFHNHLGLQLHDVTHDQRAALDSDAHRPPMPVFPKPLTLRRNMTEASRLQGLMHRAGPSSSPSSATAEASTLSSQLRHWFINEGGRRTFFALWVLVHALVFSFGFVHYQLKDNLNGARGTFGWTFATARASALVLHVDVAVLLLPVCRNAVTLIRRTYLNQLIPFDAK